MQPPMTRVSWHRECKTNNSLSAPPRGKKVAVGAQARSTVWKFKIQETPPKGPLNVNSNSLKDAFAIYSQLSSTVFVTYRILLVAAGSLSFTFVRTKPALLKLCLDSEMMRSLPKMMLTAIDKLLMRNLDRLNLWVASFVPSATKRCLQLLNS
jgi:hypothetical protein